MIIFSQPTESPEPSIPDLCQSSVYPERMPDSVINQ